MLRVPSPGAATHGRGRGLSRAPLPRAVAPLPALLGSLALLALMAPPARAQSAGDAIRVTAVVGKPIKVTGARALAFTNVLPGVAQTVAATSASAGQFSADGTANAEVEISFNFPNYLFRGSSWIKIDGWTECVGTGPTQSACTPLSLGPVGVVRLRSNNGKLSVWIGATVRPAADVPASGATPYTGTVQMTALYTGY